MVVNVSSREGVSVVSVSGSMRTGAGAGEFQSAVHGLVASGERRILFDLSKVPWMDSGGIGVVAEAGAHIKRNEGRVNAVLSKKVHDLWTVVRLSDVFEIEPDIETAVRDLAE